MHIPGCPPVTARPPAWCLSPAALSQWAPSAISRRNALFTHLVRVDGFWIDRHEVTNAQFRQFVDATGYVTLAERGLDPTAHPGMPDDLLVPGSVVFLPADRRHAAASMYPWWQYVPGANWRQPDGPGSSIAGKENHPVVHVAYEDALAYARWLGRSFRRKRSGSLPPAAGAMARTIGRAHSDADGKPIANTWQGVFPVSTPNDDGYEGTAPSDASSPTATASTI